MQRVSPRVASLAALAAFGVAPAVRSAVHAQQSICRSGRCGARSAARRRRHSRRAADADVRSARAAGHRLSYSHARSRRRVDGRLGTEGRDPPLAIAAASEGALSERAAVVRPAGDARCRHDRALQRVDGAREVRPQQAGADLHPDGRRGGQAPHVSRPAGNAAASDALAGRLRSRRSPA